MLRPKNILIEIFSLLLVSSLFISCNILQETTPKAITANYIKRFDEPAIKPTGSTFESKRTYNPTLAILDKKLFMVYRAEGKHTGTGVLCLAEKTNSEKYIEYNYNPILSPDTAFDILGCEDPRIVNFGNTYYLYYTGSHTENAAHICCAKSKDLIIWTKFGLTMYPKYTWESNQIKAPAPVPLKIHNKYYMYYLGQKKPWHTSIGLAESIDLIHWTESRSKPILEPRNCFFDSTGVEPGVCVEIPNTNYLLLLYNGWDKTHINKTGWAIFDKNNPAKLVRRCIKPIVSIPNKHVFTSALKKYNKKWYIYWGADDYEIQGGIFDMKFFKEAFVLGL